MRRLAMPALGNRVKIFCVLFWASMLSSVLMAGCNRPGDPANSIPLQGQVESGQAESGLAYVAEPAFPQESNAKQDTSQQTDKDQEAKVETEWATATFGNGCFWCTEAVFQRVKGVKTVVSGFSGGHVENPDYYEVCQGNTGHAEVLQITYDPKVVSFEKLLQIFWKTHDPTTLNRQGFDVGTQYRSAVFYHNDTQKELAEKYKKKLDDSGAFDRPIVTEITKFEQFYPAGKEHQNYYNLNRTTNRYCQQIDYKLEKFRKAFADVIDKEKDKVGK